MTSDRLIRIDFYPHDWLVHTQHMTPDQRGVFVQLCMLIYANRGPIKNDAKWIGQASNCSPRMARSLVDKLVEIGDIQITTAGFITQKRCESELKRWRTWRENSTNTSPTPDENQPQSKKNKDLPSPVKNPLHYTPSHYKDKDPLPHTGPAPVGNIAKGVLKNVMEGKEAREYNARTVQALFKTETIASLETTLLGFPMDVFFQDYASNINKNGMPNYPNKAVLKWAVGWVERRRKKR